MTSPFGFAVNVPKRVPRRGPQDIPAAPFGFAPPPSKMQQTLEILNEYNPLPMFERLMKSPMASGGEISDQNIADGLGITMGLTGASAFAPKPTNALNMGIKAFHGSPHSFDKFDMDKIGTGEGAQAYGHGLYFAENEGVAKGYRDALSPEPSTTQEAAQRELDRFGGDAKAAADHVKAFIDENAAGMFPETVDHYRQIESVLRGDLPMTPGSMYEVNINADPNAFLDWDKPLSEQPEAVRRALGLDKLPGPPTDEEIQAVFALANQRGVDAFEMPEYKALEARLDNYKSDAWKQMGIAPPYRGDTHLWADAITGGEYVHGLEKGELGPMGLATSTPNASRILKEKGIPGIKYLDAGSRYTPANLPNNPIANEARQFLDAAQGDSEKALQMFRESNPVERWGGTERDEITKVIKAAAKPVTRNYVVFDDKLIEIVRKYGIAGASAMLGYNILDGMDPAQADELKRIEGNQ